MLNRFRRWQVANQITWKIIRAHLDQFQAEKQMQMFQIDQRGNHPRLTGTQAAQHRSHLLETIRTSTNTITDLQRLQDQLEAKARHATRG